MIRLPGNAFWAKLEVADEELVGWHPVGDHCADVAACCEALLERTLLSRRLARLGGCRRLDRWQVARLCVLAALHDLGKFGVGFQNKAPGRRGPRSGHLPEALALFFADGYAPSRAFFDEAFPAAELESWADEETLCRLLVATIGHHGRPVATPSNPEVWWWTRTEALNPFAGIAALVEDLRKWFPAAWEIGGDPLPGSAPFQHAWSGLVTLADWLGSDSERFFPLRYGVAGGRQGDRMPFARTQAALAVAVLGLDAGRLRRQFGAEAPGWERVLGGARRPRPEQQAIGSLALDPEGGVAVLEAATGSGKTEAALMHFLRLYQKGWVDGLYFALPTRAAATQIFERVAVAVGRVFPDPAHRPPVVLAVPGYLRVDDVEGVPLPGFKVLWSDDPRERHRFRGWAAERPKRYLVGAVAVGTVDQVLLSSLQVSHAHMRSSALLRQLLVVDEVHASDLYMGRLLEAVLDQHLAAGGHALLMSATLGAAARSRLLAPPTERRSGIAAPSLDEAIAVPYPAISIAMANGTPEVLAVAGERREKRVELRLRPVIEEPEAIARVAVAAAAQGARVLVIRNTVGGCLAVQSAVEELSGLEERLLFECEGVVAPHHSRYGREDRRLLDRAVEAQYSGDSPVGEGRILVATQTVEQSLDIDADLLITDLCPIDVLLQRIGRLHRHDKQRPSGFGVARVEVLVSQGDLGTAIRHDGEARGLHGAGTVYEDLRSLELCRRLAGAHPEVSLPRENRRLVEEGTHPEALEALVAELGGDWTRHQEHVLGTAYGRIRHAAFNTIDRTAFFSPIPSEAASFCFPEGEDRRRMPTRLGAQDRLVRLPQAPLGPFGPAVDEVTIPEHVIRPAPPPADVTEAEDVRLERRGFSFRFGSWLFRYDRLGLRTIPNR